MLESLYRPAMRLLGAAGLAGLLAAAPAAAQDAPKLPFEGSITIVVPYPAGGTSDAVGRIVGAELEKSLGRTVVVENRTGAGGRVAALSVKSEPADGSVIMIGNIVMMVLAPLTFSDIGYDPLADFAPITKTVEYAIVLATGAMSGAEDLKGLAEWFKAHPEQANYGIPAAGSLPHLFGIKLAEASSLPLNAVAYRGGAPIANALMGGQVAAGISATGDFGELHRAGKLTMVAASGPRRPVGFDDVPTFMELGYEGFDSNGWSGFFAPGGTPPEVVAVYNKAITDALKTPAVQDKLKKFGFMIVPTTPEALTALIKEDRAKWGPLIDKAGVKQ